MKPITEKQTQYAYEHCFEPFAKKTSKGIYTCSDCAHSWEENLSHTPCHVTCPKCGRKLKVKTDRKKILNDKAYFTVLTTVKGYQVLRHFFALASYRVGEKVSFSITEVVQRWLTPKGVTHTLARKRNMCSYYFDNWSYGSELELRSNSENYIYDIDAVAVFPKVRISETVRRNGYQGETYGLSHYDVFKAILSDNRKETLLKCGQTSLFHHFAIRKEVPIHIWNAIRIAIRHKYAVTDAALWCDYIDLLRQTGKDITNPHYVCPLDLAKEHDRLSDKIHKEEAKMKEMEHKKKAEQYEDFYHETKKKFLGLVFGEGNILIRVLNSVKEFVEEGEVMKHCVFANEYFKHTESLILSAMVDGVKTETIEVSLDTMKVVQCRGKCNMNSTFHEDILRVMNKNIYRIEQRMCS